MNTTDRKTRPCSHCGQAFAPEQLIPFQDELLCPACLDEQTTVCSCCGERIYKTDNSGTDTIPLCEDCYDNHYERCTHCGALIHRRDTYYRGDDPYCYDCYHTLPAQGINDYYFKPEPIFYGTGKRYFGVELEVDEGGESDSNAERVLDIANTGNELIYCKHDGSLNDGFEIVTHPMTLKQHKIQQTLARLQAGELWENSDFVFTNEVGHHVSPNSVYNQYKRIVASIGLPQARFHDLRHSYAVAAIQSGDDIKTVQGNLSHATASFTLDVYGHVTDQMKQNSAARMEKFIEKVSGE